MITVAAFLVLIAGLIYFIIIPSINNIHEMGAKINDLRLDLEDKYQKGQSLKQLNKNLAIIEEKINYLDNALLPSGKELEFISAMENLAEEKKVNIKVTLGDVKKYKKYNFSVMPVNFSAEGSYQNLYNFIAALESLDYYLNIQQLEINANNKSDFNSSELTNNKAGITASISANSYWK